MNAFSDPNECNIQSMVNSYQDMMLDHHTPYDAMAMHSQGTVQAHNNASQPATPVISLFKLKNFLYQPKFKNLIHTEGTFR